MNRKHIGSQPQRNQGIPLHIHNPIQQRLYNELVELTEKVNPQDNETSRQSFFPNFEWSDTTLSSDEQQQVEKSSLNSTTILPDFVLILTQTVNSKSN